MNQAQLIDREAELGRLRGLYERSEPALVLLYGRRRMGKTYLLSRAWPAERAFYFTASETTPAQNREALIRAFSEWSGEPIQPVDFPTWRSVFRYLFDYGQPDPLILTLDEFQYLAESERDLKTVASELNAAWEMPRAPRTLLLILSGSSVRTLERLNAGGSPLYGRFAWQARLRPFDYWHAAELAGFQDLRDGALAYGAFGGTPRYLTPVDSARPISENIIELLLQPSGEVRELIQTALYQEQGLRSIPKYVAILRAIGRGRTQLNDVAQSVGVDSDPALREKLERLIDLDYIRAGRNLGANPKEAYRYRVSDPAFRFYYEFVAPLESTLEVQPPALVWEKYIAERMNAYMGFIFESMVEEAYYRLSDPLGLPLVREWGRWEGTDRNRQSLEMDIACTLLDKRVLTGAIKWNSKPIDVDVHVAHLGMLDRLADAGIAWAHTAGKPSSPLLYVAAGGFKDDFRRVAASAREEVYLWTLEDLYQPV